MENQLSIGQTN